MSERKIRETSKFELWIPNYKRFRLGLPVVCPECGSTDVKAYSMSYSENAETVFFECYGCNVVAHFSCR